VKSLAQWEPIYEELPGWGEDITDVRRREDLPREAQEYVVRIEEWAGLPVTFIGVGPDRKQAIL
jgi:adenylosuccinate synthase